MKLNLNTSVLVIVSLFVTINSIGVAHSNESFKSPDEFTSPNDWLQYVTKHSLSEGRKKFTKVGLSLMGSWGRNAIEMEKGKEELPEVYKAKLAYPEHVRALTYFRTSNFNLGPYVAVDGQSRAITDYCRSKSGSMVGDFCETRTGPLFFFTQVKIGEHLHRLTLIEPAVGDKRNQRYFLENMKRLGYMGSVSRERDEQRVLDLANESSRRERSIQRQVHAQPKPKALQVGEKVCVEVQATVQEYMNFAVLGVPQYRDKEGFATITAFVERDEGDRLQLRNGGVSFLAAGSEPTQLNSFTYNEVQLTPGMLFWDKRTPWRSCWQ